MDKPLIPHLILGAGGHAKVLIDVLYHLEIPIKGICDNDPNSINDEVFGVKVIGNDNLIKNFTPEQVLLVNGIGSVEDNLVRRRIFEQWNSLGYHFATVVHPAAIISTNVILEEGVQVMAGAVIQPDSRIETNSIINTNASIDHDCLIGAHTHIAPGVTLSGGVSLGENCHLGTGAVVIQGVKIGPNCFVAAGSVVTKDIADNTRVKGIPGIPF